eukprot:339526-Pyramimonas_sp.AAC.1
MRVYVTAAAKRPAVVKEDDLLAKAAAQTNPVKYAGSIEGVKHHDFEIRIEVEVRKERKGYMERTIRLRLVLRGFTDLEAFDVETFSWTTRRSSQRLFASAAACKKQWIIASLDINMAVLKGLTYQE